MTATAELLSHSNVSAACRHCGAAVARTSSSAFCCRGCETVFSLLKSRGLEQYYELKTAESAPSKPEFSPDETFAYLDDPHFLALYAGASTREMRFYLEGVHCAACVWLTEKLPQFIPGVESLTLSLATGIARVRLNESGKFSEAAREIARLGYRPHPVRTNDSEPLQKKETRKHLVQLGIAGMASGNIMLLAIALYAGADGRLAELFRWASFAVYLPVFFVSSTPFYRSAWASLRSRRVSIDVPIVLGLLVGTGASIVNLTTGSPHIYFDSLSALVFLLLSTRYLLRRIHQHAAESAQWMHFVAPARARRLHPETLDAQEVHADALEPGDLIEVLPGECFAADGTIIEGESTVNCALLTGEAEWIAAGPGSTVAAGTWNQSAPLRLRVSHAGASTRLGKILHAMEESLKHKAPIVTLVDRVGQGFVVAVLLLAALGFFLGLSTDLHEALNRALAVAIVVCPCTFALATPLALSLAISRCAKAGLLVKTAEVIERLSLVKHVFLDKTGTLTHGELRCEDWIEHLPGTADALLALELQSSHPIAKAVQRYFRDSVASSAIPSVAGFREVAGIGVSGHIDGVFYEVRSSAPIESPDVQTAVSVFRNGVVAGSLTLSDSLRDGTRAVLTRLQKMNLKMQILSGDHEKAVQAVAKKLALPAHGSLSPEAKATVLRSTPHALMVGDGANDAPALSAAFVGMAVKGGMEMSLRAAGVYSSVPGIDALPGLITVSRETMRVIRRNLAFAVLYNGVGLAVALSGNLNPLIAAILMPLSALTVFVSTLVGTRPLRHAFPVRSEIS